MSEADKMFEELGYKKEEHKYKCGNVIEYDDGDRQIDFMFKYKEIKMEYCNGYARTKSNK